MSRLFVSLILSGSKFNFPIISDIHPFSIVYCFIIIVTKGSCASLDHLYFIYKYLGVVSHADDDYSRS